MHDKINQWNNIICFYLFQLTVWSHNITQVLNMLCCWVEDENSEAFKLHLPRVQDYLWVAEDGMKMQVSIIFLFC